MSLGFLSQSGGLEERLKERLGVSLLLKFVLSAGKSSSPEPLASTIEPQVNISIRPTSPLETSLFLIVSHQTN